MVSNNYSYSIIIIYLHSYMFHLFLSNTKEFLYNFIWPIDGTITVTTTRGQSGPENILHFSEVQNWSLTTGCSLVLYPGDKYEGELKFSWTLQGENDVET